MQYLIAHLGGHIHVTSGTTGGYKKILIDPECEAVLSRYYFQKAMRISKRSVFALFNFSGAGP